MSNPDRVITYDERFGQALRDAERARIRSMEVVAHRAWRSYFLGILTGVALAATAVCVGAWFVL